MAQVEMEAAGGVITLVHVVFPAHKNQADTGNMLSAFI